LVPTRELAEQVLGHLRGLVKYCESDISMVNVAGGVTAQLQRCDPLPCSSLHTDTERLSRVLLSDRPHVVIGTPSKVLALLQAKVTHIFSSSSHHCLTILKTLSLSHLDSLVIDEADLILSYGHDEDIRSIFAGNFLPKVYQSFLMSATMTEDVETLKGLALRNPVRQCPVLTRGILELINRF
jgi:ATP-dependent RNA helicase DDX56/DBP9